MSADPVALLEVADLRTFYYLDEGVLKAVDGVSFRVHERKTLGVIGESGCGKSATALSILRIVPHPGRLVGGSIRLKTRGGLLDLAGMDPNGEAIRSIRGKEITMIFQEPMTSFSPVHTIGNQIMEAILLHRTPDRREAREIALDMLARVGISNPRQRIDEYPHQLSGGMRQRAMIAMALSCNPSLLIADEPTTALDVTVQAQILDLMRKLQEELAMSVLYITHDLGVIAEIADEIAVMYLGKIVEYASTRELFAHPLHPYTQRLLKSIPKVGRKARVRLEAITGTVPIPLDPAWECGFRSRCSESIRGTCDTQVPALEEASPRHFVRCFLRHAVAEQRNE